MSVLSDLLSLEGLFTFTVGSVVTFRALRLTWIRNEGNVSIVGNNNIILYNQNMAKGQGSYKLLWNILAVVMAIFYPLFGENLNIVLRVLALMAIPVSLLSVVWSFKTVGSNAIFGLFYAAGTAALWWLVSSAATYLSFAAQQTAQFFGNIHALFPYFTTPLRYGENLLTRGEITLPRLQQVGFGLLTMIGFALLAISTCYLAFGLLKGRHFDDAIRFTVAHLIIALLGYVLICNVPLALTLGDWAYIKNVFSRSFPVY